MDSVSTFELQETAKGCLVGANIILLQNSAYAKPSSQYFTCSMGLPWALILKRLVYFSAIVFE